MSDYEDMKSLSNKSVGLKRDPNTSFTTWNNNLQTKPLKNPFIQEDFPKTSTTITEDVSIKGEIAFSDSLRVDGHFEGKLISDGILIVGPNGSLKADVKLKSAIIEGKVTGNIEVMQSLELASSAEVTGDIIAPLLKVEAGAKIQGSLIITREED